MIKPTKTTSKKIQSGSFYSVEQFRKDKADLRKMRSTIESI